MEGESLLNDATAISLFQVFFVMVKNIHPEQNSAEQDLTVLEQLLAVAGQIVWLAVGMPGQAGAFALWPKCLIFWRLPSLA